MIPGTSCIGEYLKENHTLQVFDIGGNPIGDIGISLLMKGLRQNTSLIELCVEKCELSVKGTILM